MRSKFGMIAGLVAAAISVPAMAAPLVNLSLVGRVVGSGSAFSSQLNNIPSGTQVEYQLIADVAPVGTVRGAITINSLTKSQATTGDGVNNLKIDLVTVLGGGGVVTFGAGGTLNGDPDATLTGDSWANGTGASGGVPTGNDLLGVRPAHSTGLQSAIDPEVVMTGQFTFTGNADLMTVVGMRWASGGAGSGKVNGGANNLIISASSEGGADPFVSYAPLQLNVPEPTTASLLALGLLGAAARRRRA